MRGKARHLHRPPPSHPMRTCCCYSHAVLVYAVLAGYQPPATKPQPITREQHPLHKARVTWSTHAARSCCLFLRLLAFYASQKARPLPGPKLVQTGAPPLHQLPLAVFDAQGCRYAQHCSCNHSCNHNCNDSCHSSQRCRQLASASRRLEATILIIPHHNAEAACWGTWAAMSAHCCPGGLGDHGGRGPA